MINIADGDILADPADAIVSPVNLMGVAGAGLAKAIAQAYPAAAESYRMACRTQELHMGAVHSYVCYIGQIINHVVIHFPTKRHWQDRSYISEIELTLPALAEKLHFLWQCRVIKSVAIPALGCGLGGLNQDEVIPMIQRELAGLPLDRITIYRGRTP